jgi:hypothetical protein
MKYAITISNVNLSFVNWQIIERKKLDLNIREAQKMKTINQKLIPARTHSTVVDLRTRPAFLTIFISFKFRFLWSYNKLLATNKYF